MSFKNEMNKNAPAINPLISVDELLSLKSQIDLDLVVLDGSWHLPTDNRNPKEEFQSQCLPGALFFDIDAVCDTNSNLPHMLPSAGQFETAVRELGISGESHVVVYDTRGLFSAARVWWMFRVFGHQRVQVLDGGMPAWIAAGAETSSGDRSGELSRAQAEIHPSKKFNANFNQHWVADKNDVQKASKEDDVVILDARSIERFNGKVPEPRAGLESGHIPGSRCLPFTELLTHGHFRDKADLEKLLRSYGLLVADAASGKQSVITSCGSGVTAAVITLALDVTGFGLQRLYDGSWAEWGRSATDRP